MIGIIFRFGSDILEVRIKDSNVFFRTSQFQSFGDIDGIKLNKEGALREFPDLKDNDDWQKIVRERFKEKIKKMKTEREIAEYVKKDLTKYGYFPMYEQKKGWRIKKIK